MPTGDTYYYANGTPYIVTDHGPNMWVSCYVCGEPCCCTPEVRVRDARCGICMSSDYGLLPGQPTYEARSNWWAKRPRLVDRIKALQKGVQ